MRLFSVIISMAAGFALISCSKSLLDEASKSNITAAALFGSPEGLASATTALYNRERLIFRGSSDAESVVWTNQMKGTDITVTRGGAGVQFARYDVTLNAANAQVRQYWSHFYYLIVRANEIIAAGEDLGMDNEMVRQAVAEAKVIRAHSYFYLIRRYDRIILNDQATTVGNVEREFRPADPAEVFGLINADLDFAIDALGWVAANPGRYTQGAARHIKAKVALWQQDWEEAALQADEIINNGPYALVPLERIFDGGDLNHSEGILVSQWDRAPGGASIGGPAGHRLAQYFIPNYYKISGILVNGDNGGRAWGRVYPNTYLLGLYEEGDDRYNTFYKHYWVYDDPDNLPAGRQLGERVTTTNSGVYFDQLHPACTKFLDKWTKEPTEAQSFKDIIIYRLAETYLIGAEAHMRLKGSADGTARNYISKVRERAGLGVYNGPVTEDLILEEDARELAFEGHRWFNLKRMGKLVERVRLYSGDTGVGAIQPRQNIQDFHVRWPIPQSEIDMMGAANFPQNPGYN